MRVRILFLITDLQVGGAPRVVKELACALALAKGDLTFDVQVACLAPAGPVAEQLRNHGIVTHCLGALGPWDVRVFWRLGRLIRRFRPEILHCSLMHANVAGRIIGRLLAVPGIIASIHTAEQGKLWHLVLENLTCRLGAVTVCVSDSVRRHVARYAHIPPSRLKVIANGIDGRRFAQAVPMDLALFGIKTGRVTLIFVGRLDAVKAIDVLLYSLARLVNIDGCDAQLLVVGDGPQRPVLESLCRKLKITDRVCFCGLRRDVERLLKTADIYVQPSRWEGLPLSVLEAMAAGLPVVASRTEGLTDIIENGRTGLLAPVGDSRQLADKIMELVENPNKAQILGRSAQNYVRRRHSLGNMINAYMELYRSLL